MKVVIPTKNRQDKITTHRVFPDAVVLVHDIVQKNLYLKYGMPSKRIIVTNTEPDAYGLTRQREWAVKNIVPKGEWFVFADDNIKSLSWVPQPFYNMSDLSCEIQKDQLKFRKLFRTDCSWMAFRDIVIPDMVQHAERIRARMCGFSVTDNAFFRGKKFRSIGYVIGKLQIVKNEGLTWDHTITMEDFRNTADHLLRFGAVLINNYVFPVANHYQSGGMGTIAERVPYRKYDVKRLMFLYGNLFRVKERKGFEPNTDLQIAIHTKDALSKWRREIYERWKSLSKGIHD